MKFIPLSSITIPDNRQRRYHDPSAHQELITSICDTAAGLQNALVVRNEGGRTLLVSGERRLRALSEAHELGRPTRYLGVSIPHGSVPVVEFESLDALEAEEAELDENIRRSDLTWQERAQAVDRLFSLRTQQAEIAGTAPPTVADIAEEVRGSGVGQNQVTTRREIILAKHLDNPEVAKATSVEEAFKVIKRQETSRKNREASSRVASTYGSSNLTIHLADALEWLRTGPAEAFDCVITDPPYGMGAHEFGDSGGAGSAQGSHFYDDSPESFMRLQRELWPLLAVAMKPESHLYMFCDIGWFSWLKELAEGCGLKVFRTPFIWHKPTAMRAPWPEMGPQRKWEAILYAVKGGRPTRVLKGDVLTYPPDANLGHHAQKPVALFEDLLGRSCGPGDSVLDPFCGSGPVFSAAKHLTLTATGLEINPEAHGIAVQRIAGLVL